MAASASIDASIDASIACSQQRNAAEGSECGGRSNFGGDNHRKLISHGDLSLWLGVASLLVILARFLLRAAVARARRGIG